jgi:transcriptional regulator with GAF, ATPase, and Fis domain
MPAKFVVLSGPICGETFPIEADETTIGRDSRVDLSIPDRLMSRRHCAVKSQSPAGFMLVDLDSSNGTAVNGVPVREHLLEHGDRIRVGDSLLLFLLSAERAAFPDSEGRSEEIEERTARIASVIPIRNPPRRDAPIHDMIGSSPAMRAVYSRIQKIASADCTVLIHGETGTGKELAARAIHQSSSRAAGPFVAVNCAALTDSLLESELFGHERGAFTGAVALKKGKLELAHGGALLLDEIGELAPALQAKLLRALQYREFERVGGTRTIRVDVRLLAATNRDLSDAVETGGFRPDLWYRLNVVSLTMPSLRARRSDIPLLASHFARKHGRGRIIEISREALESLCAYDWPGNVRELENAIESAVVLGSAHMIAKDDLPRTIVERAPIKAGAPAPYHRHVLDAKRQLILDAIEQSGGRFNAAARLLGLNPTYLHRLVRNLNLRDHTVRR